MSPQECKIEAALIDWFRQQGWEIDRTHQATLVVDNEQDVSLELPELARYVADEINR